MRVDRPRSRMSRPLKVFILAYLLIQVAIPLRQFAHPELDRKRAFAWNMYSKHWTCSGGYRLTTPDGTVRDFDFLRAFNRASGAGKVTYRDRLPEFHHWMCERISEGGDLGRLEGRITCAVNDSEPVELVSAGIDICEAPNYGVTSGMQPRSG